MPRVAARTATRSRASRPDAVSGTRRAGAGLTGMESPIRTHGAPAIGLHWLTAILVLAAFAMGPGGSEERTYAAGNDFDREIHEVLGLTVLVLTLARLALRAMYPPPAAEPSPRWMRLASSAGHGLLYALLVVTPLSAIAGAWLEGHALTLGLLGNVGPWIAPDPALGKSIAKIHTILGDAIMWLAGLHAGAALFHQFVLRDGVLASMLPLRILRRGQRAQA